MKIIHFVPYFPPDRVGGVGDFVAGLHEALIGAGHDSLVVSSGRTSTNTVRRITKSPLAWLFKISKWVSCAAQYDIVHCQGGEALAVVLLLKLRKKRCKTLATFHVGYREIAAAFCPYTLEGRIFGRGLKNWLYRTFVCRVHQMLDWTMIWLCDEVNTISRQCAIELLGVMRARTTRVVYCGVPDIRENEGERSTVDPFQLLYVGCGGHRKRVRALPLILGAIHKRIPTARMRIIGFCPEGEPETYRLFNELGLLSCIEFVGAIPSGELPKYYAQAQVLVVPSAYEGLPLVVLEAMRSGLPVVASNVGAISEALVDGENGYLVEVDRPDLVAVRCVELLEDRGLRRRIAQNSALEFQKRFRLGRQVEDYLDLYHELLASPD
jgi:glycosyltransferase involved in cell wall biosynthesis